MPKFAGKKKTRKLIFKEKSVNRKPPATARTFANPIRTNRKPHCGRLRVDFFPNRIDAGGSKPNRKPHKTDPRTPLLPTVQ